MGFVPFLKLASLRVALRVFLVGWYSVSAQTVLVPAGAAWKYRDTGVDPSLDWTTTVYGDAARASALAPLGYGDPVATTVGYGPNPDAKYTHTWFSHACSVARAAAYASLTVRLRRDDGAVVRLKDVELLCSNMPEGPIDSGTVALPPAVSGADETTFVEYSVPNGLQDGANVIAVEIHQVNADSSDLSFDLSLEATPASGGHPANTSNPVEVRREPLGPSTARTDLVVSEIHYHPRGDDPNLEFVELYNTGIVTHDLSGWRLSGQVSYTFPAGTTMAPGAFLVVGLNPILLQSTHGISGVLGPWTGQLSDSGGTLRLRNARDAVLLEVPYHDAAPWPVAPDGAGPSLVLARASWGEASPNAWEAGDLPGGTPGRAETWSSHPLDVVCVNEVLVHSTNAAGDYIELFNRSTNAVDLSGAWLTDNAATNKFCIPNGTTLAPLGFGVFYQATLGFALDAEGEAVFLVSPNQTRVIDAQKIGSQGPGMPLGRVPNGSLLWSELAVPSPGASNGPALDRPIVINELHYHPLSEQDEDEFVELHNRSAQAVDVGGWRFVDGIDLTLPAGTVIPAQGFLAVARDVARLRSNHPHLTSANSVGDYAGALDDGGERVALAMPVTWLVTNGPALSTNTAYVIVDEVTYPDGGRWGQWADGGGSSLELIDPRSDNRQAPNWADSDETAKAPWTNLEFTGPLDNGRGTLDEVHAILLGSGEALLDEVEFRFAGGANLVRNPGFETGLTDWWLGGNHIRSSLSSSAYAGTAALHLRATAAGDTGANRVECDLTESVVTTDAPIATLRAKFRWLRGHPDVLLRVQGNYLEAVARLATPANPGTPGLPNSVRVSNAGPAITDVAHHPTLPAADTPAIVTARIHDPDGVALAELHYRIDPGATLLTVTLRDDGTGGDAIPADGVFTAAIPGQPTNTLAAWHLTATDGPGAAARFPANSTSECLVLFGQTQPAGTLGTYRFWMTAANRNAWINREKMSNEPIEGTMVYGDARVIHGTAARYRGSPFMRGQYTTPDDDQCGYIWTTPDDEPFLGNDELNLDSLEPGAGTGDWKRDTTALREATSFTMAEQLGLPFSHQRFVRLYINGISNAERNIPVYTHSQQVDSDYMRSWFPDADDGLIYKIDDWFEYNDSRTGPGKLWNENGRLNRYTSGGALKKARYRWSWERKFNRGWDDDYSAFFDLVETVNTPAATYVQRMEATLDVEQWLTVFALRHAVADYDGYGYDRGKNQFIYLPPRGRWQMLLWDLDFSLGCSGRGTTYDIFSRDSGDQTLTILYNHPHFRRAYYRSLERCLDGPFQPANYLPALTERYAGLQSNSIPSASPFLPTAENTLSLPAWISARHDFIRSNIPQANFAVSSPAGSSVSTTSNVVTLAGTAPVRVARLLVNGQAYPITWSSVTIWILRVPVTAGTTLLVLSAEDATGAVIPGITQQITVTYTGTLPDPRDHLVINELAYDRTFDTEYVELLNTSPSFTFDLSGWRLNGLDYTFPGGAAIQPGEFLVLMKDRVAFNSTHPGAVPAFDQFPGNFDPDGETLSLKQVFTDPPSDRVIDQVRYEIVAPWATKVSAPAGSLQLRDASRDNARVSNWTNTPASPGVANTGTAALPAYPGLWLNEIQPENLTGLADRFGEREPWVEIVNDASSAVPLNGCSLARTYGNLTEWAFPNGTLVPAGGRIVVFLDGEPGEGTTAEPHASFRPSSSAGSLAFSRWLNGAPQILDYLNYTNLLSGQSYGSLPDVQPFFREVFGQPTPGQPNDALLGALPVRINEFMAANNTTLPNPVGGAYDDWIELINLGPGTVNLAGYALTDHPTNDTHWAFPNWAALGPYERVLVWADGHPEYNQPGQSHLHADFKLSAAGEGISLRALDGTPVDELVFGTQTPDLSMGRCEEGVGALVAQARATPGLANACGGPPPQFSGATWMGNGTVRLRWNATPGRCYQVVYKPSLADPEWLELAPPAMAMSPEITLDTPAFMPSRFYRLVLLP